jgi:osmotically-inducible protein OsmY
MLNLFKKTDPQIQQDVINELHWDPRVTDTQINVMAKDGIVTLRGSVPHHFEKNTAEKAAQRVGGVRAVADELGVNLLASDERSDEDIARAALMAIEWNYQVPDGVKITVDKACITLRGEVKWEFERSAAEEGVSTLMGVRGVTNEISIQNSVQLSDIQTRIEDALNRSAESEGRKIRVTVDRGEVTLSGNVHSFSEMEDAKLTAWGAPGVMKVENNLELTN